MLSLLLLLPLIHPLINIPTDPLVAHPAAIILLQITYILLHHIDLHHFPTHPIPSTLSIVGIQYPTNIILLPLNPNQILPNPLLHLSKPIFISLNQSITFAHYLCLLPIQLFTYMRIFIDSLLF